MSFTMQRPHRIQLSMSQGAWSLPTQDSGQGKPLSEESELGSKHTHRSLSLVVFVGALLRGLCGHRGAGSESLFFSSLGGRVLAHPSLSRFGGEWMWLGISSQRSQPTAEGSAWELRDEKLGPVTLNPHCNRGLHTGFKKQVCLHHSG